VVVHRMAHTGLTRFPVVARSAGRELLGLIALEDLLRARYLNLDAERRRERVLSVRFPFGFGRKRVVEDDDGE
jgi:chloride channel protein, CIC family